MAIIGLRVGYVYGPKELIDPLWLAHQYTVTCVDSITQDIALAALTSPKDFVESMVNEFKRRRDFIHKRLDEIGLTCMLPKGAFYVFPSIKRVGMSSEAFARFPLKKAHVMIMPGSAYGRNGEGHMRISFAASYHSLEEALDRIEKALRKFR